MSLIDHPTGNYRFLPGIAPYSCGVVASPPFEIVHVTFGTPLPYRAGFERIERILQDAHRPKTALCAIELRSPRPFTFAGFAEFNAEYAAILKQWGVFVEGMNPVARTNVAPERFPPNEPLLHGFSYTRQGNGTVPPTFIVAGGGELPDGSLARQDIIALGDTSRRGIATKAQFVMGLMENRLRGLGANWNAVSAVNVYTVHSIAEVVRDVILSQMGSTMLQSVQWHYSRPPIEEIEFEMDLRGVRSDLRLD
jgi:hypothetical protein